MSCIIELLEVQVAVTAPSDGRHWFRLIGRTEDSEHPELEKFPTSDESAVLDKVLSGYDFT